MNDPRLFVSLSAFHIVTIPYFSHSDNCSFNFISLMNKYIGHISMCLLVSYISSLVKYVCVFCLFSNCIACLFYCWVLKVLYIFWILILIRYVFCKYFLQDITCFSILFPWAFTEEKLLIWWYSIYHFFLYILVLCCQL